MNQLEEQALIRQLDLIQLLMEIRDGYEMDESKIDDFFHPDFKVQITDDGLYDYSREEVVKQAKESTALQGMNNFTVKQISNESVQIDFAVEGNENFAPGTRTSVWVLYKGRMVQKFFFTEEFQEIMF